MSEHAPIDLTLLSEDSGDETSSEIAFIGTYGRSLHAIKVEDLVPATQPARILSPTPSLRALSPSPDLSDVLPAVPETQEALYASGDEDSDFGPVRPHDNHAHARFIVPPQATEAAAVSLLRRTALEHGVCVTTKASHPAKGVRYMWCHASGLHRSGKARHVENLRTRDVRTHKTGCPFRATVRRTVDAHGTRYTVEITCEEHNHERIDPALIAHVRRSSRTPDVAREIEKLVDRRLTNEDIIAALAESFPEAMQTPKDIANFRARYQHRKMGGLSPTQYLVNRLQADSEMYRCFANSSRQTVGFSYMTPSSRALFHRYPTVLSIDDTFSTNQYGFPLLHITGFTSTNRTYTAAVIVMSRSTKEWITEALQSFIALAGRPKRSVRIIIKDRCPRIAAAANTVFPNAQQLLCVWHLRENLKASLARWRCFEDDPESRKGKSAFGTMWMDKVVRAKTEESLQAGMAELRRTYSDAKFTPVHRFLDSLLSSKTQWAHAYTNQVCNLGQHSNSRNEGEHAALKHSLREPSADMYDLIIGVRAFMGRQFRDIKQRDGHERTYNLKADKMFESLSRMWSVHAYKITYEQLRKASAAQRASTDLPPCSGRFTASMGLPCAHRLLELLQTGRILSITEVHMQWRLAQPDEWDKRLKDSQDLSRTAMTSGVQILGDDFEPPQRSDSLLDPRGNLGLRARRNAAAAARILAVVRPIGAPGSISNPLPLPDALELGTQQSQSGPTRTPLSGRLLTQSERLNGLAKPINPQCEACRKRHKPTYQCAARRTATETELEAARRRIAAAEQRGEVELARERRAAAIRQAAATPSSRATSAAPQAATTASVMPDLSLSVPYTSSNIPPASQTHFSAPMTVYGLYTGPTTFSQHPAAVPTAPPPVQPPQSTQASYQPGNRCFQAERSLQDVRHGCRDAGMAWGAYRPSGTDGLADRMGGSYHPFPQATPHPQSSGWHEEIARGQQII